MSMHVTLQSDDCVNYTFYHVIDHILHCTRYEFSVCLCVTMPIYTPMCITQR